jgi:hypothetical protein
MRKLEENIGKTASLNAIQMKHQELIVTESGKGGLKFNILDIHSPLCTAFYGLVYKSIKY